LKTVQRFYVGRVGSISDPEPDQEIISDPDPTSPKSSGMEEAVIEIVVSKSIMISVLWILIRIHVGFADPDQARKLTKVNK